VSIISVGIYCVMFYIVREDLDGVEFVYRPLGNGDNPKTAVTKFMKTNSDFCRLCDSRKVIDFGNARRVFEASKVVA